jgi:hypothetical protein
MDTVGADRAVYWQLLPGEQLLRRQTVTSRDTPNRTARADEVIK